MKNKTNRRAIACMLCGLMIISLITPMMVVYADDIDPHNKTLEEDIVRDLSLSYQLKGSSSFITLSSPYEIPDITKIEKFRSLYSFTLDDNVDPGTGLPNRTVHEGDYYIIDLPSEIQIGNPTSGSIVGNDERVIATYSFSQDVNGSWQIRVTFTDYVDDTSEYEIFGSMEFEFTVDTDGVNDGDTITISIPIDNTNIITLEITKPVPPPTTPISLIKTVTSYSNTSRNLVWNVKMMPATGIFSGCTFRDTIDTNLMTLSSIKHGSVTLVLGIDYTLIEGTGDNEGTSEIVYLIPAGRNGVNYQNIIITTNVKPSVYEKLTPTAISNQATLTGGAAFVNLSSDTATQTVTPIWLKKTGTLFQGNKIQWTLQANITRQFMYNAVVTDYLQADVLMDKSTLQVGGVAIAVYDNAHIPSSDTEIYGVYTANPDGTAVLEVYLPRGILKASNTQRNITFVTSVVAPDVVVTANPIYNNTAKLEANYITDGGVEGTLPTVNINQYGVTVPYVSVVKGNSELTADDKRNGTIPWTITAASNLSSYGSSKIVDTLPADQTYLPDEIYLGSTKIDSTTEPKAEISVDGRTLTITFATTDNALSTIKTFYVKTKINPQVYGENVNRNFSNQVTATIYDKITGLALDADSDSHNVLITNNVIKKASSVYEGNITKNGENPRINYSITINENLMPLKNVLVSDDLSKIVTEFQKSGGAYETVSGVKWKYVDDSMVITHESGTLDSLNLANIVAGATYTNDILSVDFGTGNQVNDQYKITFTIELDVSQSDVFEQNGLIRIKGNIGDITGDGLKTGTVSTPATSVSAEIKNEVLGKYGSHSIAEQQIIWTINLNQHNLGLANGKVVDILPVGLTLDPTSLKLYTNVIGSNGNFVTGDTILTQGTVVPVTYTNVLSQESATQGRYVLTVTLPDDDTAYILRFATDVSASLLGTEITNNAYFVGEALSGDDTNTTTMTLAGTSGGGSTTKEAITVNKKSADNGDALSGAVFALHWLRDGDPEDPVFVRNQTTISGATTFFGLTLGEKYTVTEMDSPTGYLLDDPNPVQISVPSDGTEDLDPLFFVDTPIKTGSFTPAAIKSLDGKAIIRDFNFVLKEIVEGHDDNTVLEGVTSDTLSNGDMSVAFTLVDGAVSLGVLDFTDSYTFDANAPEGTSHLVETHMFTLEELDDQYQGYGFDETVYQLVVKVYNVKGSSDLKVVIEDEDGTVLSSDDGTFLDESIPIFYNTYRAGGELVLEGTKELTGHSLAAQQFSFLLYEVDNEVETYLQTVGNKVGENQSDTLDYGAFSFEAIEYSEAYVGTKTYRIVEKDTGSAGYEYDDSSYIINVNILDQDDGTVVAEIDNIQKTKGEITEAVEAIVFENTYSAEDLSVTFKGTKSLSVKTLEDGQFTFIMTQTKLDGTLIKDFEAVTNMNGQIVFPTLTFTQEDRGDTFYYLITEEDAKIPGVSCDERVYSIRLTVEDNEDGTLGKSITYYVDGVETDEIAFANTYSATGTLAIAAHKTISGRLLVNSEFGFSWQLVDPLTGNSIGETEIAKNASTGDIFFPAIHYTAADDGKNFIYRIKEVNNKVRTIQYDQTEYQVKVHVTDLGDGTLQVDKKIYKVDAAGNLVEVEGILFHNSYDKSLEGFPSDEETDTSDPRDMSLFGFLAIIGLLGMGYTYGRKQEQL